MTMSPRTRELCFLLIPVLAGLIGLASVAVAREDKLAFGPLPAAAAIVALFIGMHLVLRWRAPLADPYLLPVVGLLTALGLVELDRVRPELAVDQAIWVGVGGAVFVAVLIFLPDHHVLERYRYTIGLTAVALLVATIAFGTTINGSKLWISVGGGQTVQLGELAKVLMVIFLAGYLRDKREVLAIPTTRHFGLHLPAARHFGPVVLFWGVALVAVIALNDFGTALLFFGVFLAMIYLATGRAAYAAVGAGLFVAGSAVVYALVPRVADRVDAWLHPFSDPAGRGYQLVQSLYALGDGGVVGPGLGRGFLVDADGHYVIPALPTDFIFSGVASELGYLGGVALILCFLVLVWRGFSIAASAVDGFSKLLAGGLTATLALQAFLIIGGVTRLVPLTGVTLPFMSYGGSSVVTNFGLIALLLVVSQRSRMQARPR